MFAEFFERVNDLFFGSRLSGRLVLVLYFVLLPVFLLLGDSAIAFDQFLQSGFGGERYFVVAIDDDVFTGSYVDTLTRGNGLQLKRAKTIDLDLFIGFEGFAQLFLESIEEHSCFLFAHAGTYSQNTAQLGPT